MNSRSLNAFTGMLLLLAALPALAEKPTIEYVPFPTEGMVAPTASVCGFDILAVPQAGRPNGGKLIQFPNVIITTGAVHLTLTNLNTGKAINVNISGPAITTLSGTSPVTVGMGPGVLLFPPTPLSITSAAGLPPLPLIHGRAVITMDEDFNVISMKVSGTAEDLCRLLE